MGALCFLTRYSNKNATKSRTSVCKAGGSMRNISCKDKSAMIVSCSFYAYFTRYKSGEYALKIMLQSFYV